MNSARLMNTDNKISTLHIVGGEKGGVGKSLFARLLCQYFLANDDNFIGFDADSANPSLSRFYTNFCKRIDIKQQDQLDQCIERVYEGNIQVILDLPAQSQSYIEQWWRDANLIDFTRRYNVNLCYWFVCDDSFDSMQLLKQFSANYGNEINLFVVKNCGRGAEFSAFDYLDEECKRLPNMFLNTLDRSYMYTLDQHSLSFEEASKAQSPLQSTEKRMLSEELKSIFLQFDNLITPSRKRNLRLNLDELYEIKRLIDNIFD